MMKNAKFFMLSLVAAIALSSCGTGYFTSSVIRDDIYYRPTREDRADMLAKNAEARKQAMKQYTLSDDDGHSYTLETELSYEQLLRRFDSPTYNFYYDYGVWGSPWYNPWWGIGRWHSPFYYGSWYSWYSPYSFSFYNPFYWDNFYFYGWYDPWYYGWGYASLYDPWYWGYSYYPYSYYSYYRPGFGPGPGPGHSSGGSSSSRHYYGQRTGNNGSLMSPSRQEAMRGVMPTSSSSYSNSGVYTGQRRTTARGESTTSYSRTGNTSNRNSWNSAPATRSTSPSYSGGSRSSGSVGGGGFSSGASRSGGNAGGSGTHSGGGRR